MLSTHSPEGKETSIIVSKFKNSFSENEPPQWQWHCSHYLHILIILPSMV